MLGQQNISRSYSQGVPLAQACVIRLFGMFNTVTYVLNTKYAYRTTLISPRINIFFDPAGWGDCGKLK